MTVGVLVLKPFWKSVMFGPIHLQLYIAVFKSVECFTDLLHFAFHSIC